ncbi:MAG: DUF4019 domain-containing protein [Smithella sp.]
MKRLVLIGVAIAMVLSAGISWAVNAEKEKAAVTAAQKWLTLVDAGKDSESWQKAAENFKSVTKQDKWVQMRQEVRTHLGKVVSRKLKTTAYKTTLPGAPAGQYVVIQFETSFQKKKSAIELVTCIFEKNGRWKVVGYGLKS